MQSANDTELLIEEACLELDAISDEADHQGDASAAYLNLKAAKQSPQSHEYVTKAREHIVALCGTLDPDGPYYKYARNAKELLDKLSN